MRKPSDSEVLVSCQGISKKFCRNLKKSLWYGVKDGVSEIVCGQSSDVLRKDEFWALDDVSFELHRGECLGLLGRNGAGKTTLLKVLSGLIKPDKGKITLKGKVGGLIALGAGFNGILSGRENIRINGAILGYSRDEIEDQMQEIIDFAEIPDFIDAPVNTYSSGMSVRLGFAIAAILTKPDVLLLDEVLAVGDIGFTIKCLNAVRGMMKDSAVIFVSHTMQFISQFCTECIILDKGILKYPPMATRHVITKYIDSVKIDTVDVLSENLNLSSFCFVDMVKEEYIKPDSNIKQWQNLALNFIIESKINLIVKIFIAINDNPSNHVIIFKDDSVINIRKGINNVKLNLGSIDLNCGKYSFTIAINCFKENIALLRLDNLFPFSVESDSVDWGNVIKKTKLKLT